MTDRLNVCIMSLSLAAVGWLFEVVIPAPAASHFLYVGAIVFAIVWGKN